MWDNIWFIMWIVIILLRFIIVIVSWNHASIIFLFTLIKVIFKYLLFCWLSGFILAISHFMRWYHCTSLLWPRILMWFYYCTSLLLSRILMRFYFCSFWLQCLILFFLLQSLLLLYLRRFGRFLFWLQYRGRISQFL